MLVIRIFEKSGSSTSDYFVLSEISCTLCSSTRRYIFSSEKYLGSKSAESFTADVNFLISSAIFSLSLRVFNLSIVYLTAMLIVSC
jgi:hypothetical protein